MKASGLFIWNSNMKITRKTGSEFYIIYIFSVSCALWPINGSLAKVPIGGDPLERNISDLLTVATVSLTTTTTTTVVPTTSTTTTLSSKNTTASYNSTANTTQLHGGDATFPYTSMGPEIASSPMVWVIPVIILAVLLSIGLLVGIGCYLSKRKISEANSTAQFPETSQKQSDVHDAEIARHNARDDFSSDGEIPQIIYDKNEQVLSPTFQNDLPKKQESPYLIPDQNKSHVVANEPQYVNAPMCPGSANRVEEPTYVNSMVMVEDEYIQMDPAKTGSEYEL